MLLLTTLISLALAQDAPPPDPPVEEPAPPPQVRILSTGAHGGIGSGQVQFSLYRRVMDGIGEEGGLAEVVSLRPVHGWLVRGSWAISARDRTLAGTLHAFRGEVSCDDPTPATRVRGARETLFIPGEQADMARALEERGFESLWVAEHSHIPLTRKPNDRRLLTVDFEYEGIFYASAQ